MELAVKPAWACGSLEGEAQKWTKRQWDEINGGIMFNDECDWTGRSEPSWPWPIVPSLGLTPLSVHIYILPQLKGTTIIFIVPFATQPEHPYDGLFFLPVLAKRWLVMMSAFLFCSKLKETWPGHFWEQSQSETIYKYIIVSVPMHMLECSTHYNTCEYTL